MARPVAALLLSSTYLAAVVRAQATLAAPAQPSFTGTPGTFQILGSSLVSAQQMFLGTEKTMYIIDKTENNPAQIEGHPAWAQDYTLSNNKQRPMDVVTNTFCAGGNVLGNGTWMNVGGNQAVGFGGLQADSQFGGPPYDDPDGGQSIRLLDPCDDGSCNWVVSPDLQMPDRRWYPTLETLEDGSMFIIGGDNTGGYVNDATQNNPTYEFFPSRGPPVNSPLLERTLPANLYPLTFLLPSGKLFVQANFDTVILDIKAGAETPIDNVPHAVRTYPASAGSVMLPLTPANNYTATLLFCGGTNLQPGDWTSGIELVNVPASASCVTITPDISTSYVDDDDMLEGRVMNSMVYLPNGKILNVNGAGSGTAGYGNVSWAIGQSYATDPAFTPAIYDPTAPAGSKWSRNGLSASIVPRMYHSTAVLTPDGSVLVSGSNPNADYNVGPDVTFPTEYRTERFFPSYFNQRRPQPQGILASLSYGGPYFNISLSSDDLSGNVQNVQNATVVVIRPGFSTHALNMGQRYLELATSYSGNNDGSAILHVSQLPPNPFILAPGPALLFVVVNGVPSVGVQIMAGSGQIGTQSILPVADLPVASFAPAQSSTNTTTTTTSPSKSNAARSTRLFHGSTGTSSWDFGFGLFLLSSFASWTFFL